MRTHLRVNLALFANLAVWAACTQPGQTEIARGNVLATRKDFEGALQAYRAAAEAAPNRAHPRELLGHLLFDSGRRAEARAAYQDALRVEPEAALEARLGLARLDAEAREFDRALERLNEVLEKQPNNLYALLSRASLELRAGGAEAAQRAISDTAKAMAIDQKSSAVLFLRGSSFLAAGSLAEAEAALGCSSAGIRIALWLGTAMPGLPAPAVTRRLRFATCGLPGRRRWSVPRNGRPRTS